MSGCGAIAYVATLCDGHERSSRRQQVAAGGDSVVGGCRGLATHGAGLNAFFAAATLAITLGFLIVPIRSVQNRLAGRLKCPPLRYAAFQPATRFVVATDVA